MQAARSLISRALPSGTALPIPGKSAALTRQAVRKACRKALRDPLVPFLMAGAALFAGYLALETTRREPIRYTPEAEAAMVEDFRTLTGRQPTAEDRARMKKDFITRELLFRDALDRNLHMTSPEAREVLIDKERFLIAGAPPSRARPIWWISTQRTWPVTRANRAPRSRSCSSRKNRRIPPRC